MMDARSTAGTLPQDALELRRKRALYRAQYRGTKEMDWMLGRYAAAKLETMSGEQLQTFEAFLEVGDPEINAWLLAQTSCNEPGFAALINDLRAFNSLA